MGFPRVSPMCGGAFGGVFGHGFPEGYRAESDKLDGGCHALNGGLWRLQQAMGATIVFEVFLRFFWGKGMRVA